MKRFIVIALMLLSVEAFAQTDRHDVRAGNRKFRKDNFKEAEIDYRKAVVKDSLSLAAQYNLASSLYRQEKYDDAAKALESCKAVAEAAGGGQAADRHFNAGDVALQKKDYAAAVDAFRQSLLLNPGDLEAKENYIYAKKMLENQQGGGGSDQNQDQNQNQDQDQNQDEKQEQDQSQNQNDDRQQEPQPQEQKISSQQAQQMLNAIQAKEKETQDKVNKEKAALLKSRQKEKNW